MRIAIVHDDFMQWGGAERLVAVLAQTFPNAPIYTSMLDEEVVKKSKIARDRFITSWLNKLPLKKTANKLFFSLYPVVFEGFDFLDYDLVISSSARFAHGIITSPDTHHVAYVNSPFRGFWDTKSYFGDSVKGKLLKTLLAKKLSRLRMWDFVAGQRPDKLFGNSKAVVSRIKKYWRRDAEAFYPFVDFNRFSKEQKVSFELPEEYFVIVSRLIEWKRIDLVVDAFNNMGKSLVIIGDGPDKKRLMSIAKENVIFTNFLPEEQVTYLLKNATALIHPQKEDFGMTIPEANYCGTPVIAYAEGGALETVKEKETGVFFHNQTVDDLVDAVESFNKDDFDRDDLIENAKRFSKEIFVNRWREYVDLLSKTN